MDELLRSHMLAEGSMRGKIESHMKHQPLLIGLSALLSVTFVAHASAAAPTVPSARYNKKIYYRVTSTNAAQNTGNKACAVLGKTCVGYTAVNTTAVCSILHPTAKKVTSVNGSKAGFYCDGAPQTGLACAKFKNTCEVCPACNVNADCGSDISGLFREMYVECGGPLPPPGKSSSSTAVSRPTAYGAPSLPSSKSKR